MLDAEIPVLLRKESLEALGAQLDFEKDVLPPMRHAVTAPLRVNETGHCLSSVVEFGKGHPRSDRGPNLAASYFAWRSSDKRPDSPGEGLHLPPVESGLLRFVPPKEFSECAAATLGDAGGDSISEPRKIFSKLHVRWGRTSANQSTRVLVDSDGGMPHLANYVDEVLENCEVRWAPDKAPHVPIAGTCAVSMFTQKAQVDLRFSSDLIALRAMDVSPKYSPLPPVPPKNPQEVRGDFCGGRLGTFGRPKCIQMDEGGERKNEI